MKRLSLNGVTRALIVAPHPDDETIGCGGLVHRLRARGITVDILVVTDGAASHRNSASFPPRRLAAERQRETRRAAALLGVSADRLTMLGLPDGGLDTLDRRGRTRLARALARHRRTTLVCLPDLADDHPDHRDVARAATRALRHVRRLSYLVWPRAGRPRGAMLTLPLRPTRAIKARALAQHRTQLGRIADDPTGFTIDPATRRRFLRAAELYRETA